MIKRYKFERIHEGHYVLIQSTDCHEGDAGPLALGLAQSYPGDTVQWSEDHTDRDKGFIHIGSINIRKRN